MNRKLMQSILLVEDHAIFASVLVRLLQQVNEVEVTAMATTAEEALQKLQEGDFDLVLVDVFLPKMSGITLVGLIHERYPDLPCVMLSGHMLKHYVRRSLRAGARGYLLKDDPKEILLGIKNVLDGQTHVSRQLQDA